MRTKIFFCMMLLCMLVGGCGGTEKQKDRVQENEVTEQDLDKEIEKDVTRKVKKILDDSEVIDTVTILENNMDKKAGNGNVLCKVVSKDEKVSYTRYFVAEVEYDEEETEWETGKLHEEQRDKWETHPLEGASFKEIKEGLFEYSNRFGTCVKSDDGMEWPLYPEYVKSVMVEKQETDVMSDIDVVSMKVFLGAGYIEAEGMIDVTYNYDFEEGAWKVASLVQDGEFSGKVAPEAEFDFTEADVFDDIMRDLQGQQIVYGTKYIGNGSVVMVDHSSEQKISVTKSDVSEYTMEGTIGEYGLSRTFNCSITLKKPTTVLVLKTEVYYYYADGWFKQDYPLEYTLEVVSVNDLVGKWAGTYNGSPYDGTSALEILELTADGKIVAVYTCKEEERSSQNKQMSYKVSGTIDFSTMFMDLTIEEWIEKPYNSGLYRDEVKGYIYIEEYKIEGVDHAGNIFTLKK